MLKRLLIALALVLTPVASAGGNFGVKVTERDVRSFIEYDTFRVGPCATVTGIEFFGTYSPSIAAGPYVGLLCYFDSFAITGTFGLDYGNFQAGQSPEIRPKFALTFSYRF